MYDMPAEIDVRADGALRIITLNRPDDLNAVNDNLHVGLARLWQRMTDDPAARAAVLTGSGKAFSAGGDLTDARSCSAWRAAEFPWWRPSMGRPSGSAAAWSH
jgi:enoyl-CoA hydratase